VIFIFILRVDGFYEPILPGKFAFSVLGATHFRELRSPERSSPARCTSIFLDIAGLHQEGIEQIESLTQALKARPWDKVWHGTGY
jgi:hypothetical protein